MPHDTHTHDTPADDRITTHPLGHCTRCGEPLGWVPCTNCGHPNPDVEATDE